VAAWTTEVPFHRPSGSVFFRLGNSIMPRQPPNQLRLGYGQLKDHYRLKHYLIGIPMLALFFVIVTFENRLWHGFTYSPISLTIKAGEWAYHRGWLWLTGFIACYLVAPSLIRAKSRGARATSAYAEHTVGLISRAAVAEEQWFREGSESWSWFGRLRSAFAFGFIHMANLFYPLSTILPLSLCGLVFTHVYLRHYKQSGSREEAVLASAVAHRVYNRLAMLTIGGVIVYYIVKWFVHLI